MKLKVLAEARYITKTRLPSEFVFTDVEAEDRWDRAAQWASDQGRLWENVPDVQAMQDPEEELSEHGFEPLGHVKMLTGYRAGSFGSVLFRDSNDNVFELDTLNDSNFWPTGVRVHQLHNFFDFS